MTAPFFTEVYMNGELIGLGQGKSKKLAEQDAAERALKKYSSVRLEGAIFVYLKTN